MTADRMLGHLWEVMLAVPNTTVTFPSMQTADTEVEAVHKALERYPNCYVVVTHLVY
jgi:hypothetical protein